MPPISMSCLCSSLLNAVGKEDTLLKIYSVLLSILSTKFSPDLCVMGKPLAFKICLLFCLLPERTWITQVKLRFGESI